MGFEKRRIRVAEVLAAALAMMAAPAAGGDFPQDGPSRGTEISAAGPASGHVVRHETKKERDSNGCTITLHDYHYGDGSRCTVKMTVCEDGSEEAVERHYDSRGNLVDVSGHQITADGAVLLVKDPGGGAVPAVEASSQGSESELPDVSANDADRERVQEWLDEKFKEWKAEVEAQQASPDHGQ